MKKILFLFIGLLSFSIASFADTASTATATTATTAATTPVTAATAADHTTAPAIAGQICPKTVTATGAAYTPPAGWHTTYEALTGSTGNNTLLFYISVYNYDHKIGDNEHRISCVYKDRANRYEIEITTDQNNFPNPSNDRWQALDEKSSVCAPKKQLDPTSCPWG